MGRAKGSSISAVALARQTRATPTVSGFDAVLGTRRGSAVAQAQRDAAEAVAQAQHAAAELQALDSFVGTFLSKVVSYEEIVEELVRDKLGSYFASAPSAERAHARAQHVVGVCQGRFKYLHGSVTEFRRLQPLLDSIEVLLAKTPEDEEGALTRRPQLATALRALQDCQRLAREGVHQTHGFSKKQVDVLTALASLEAAEPERVEPFHGWGFRDVCQAAGLENGRSVTRILVFLESKNLVKSRQWTLAPRVNWMLTDAGRALKLD